MAQKPGSGGNKPAFSVSEMSTETRLLLAFGLMGVVLIVSQYFLAPPPKPPVKKADSATAPKASQPAKTGTPAAETTPPPPAAVPPAEAVTAARSERYIIETDVYRVVFSNRGAVVQSWVLKNYKDNNGKPVELVSAAAAPVAGWPMAYVIAKGKLATNLNDVLFRAEQPDPLSLDFTYSDGSLVAKKSFRFDPKLYRLVFSSEITQAGQGVTHLLAWRGGFGDRTVHNAVAKQNSVHYDAPNNKLVVETSDVAKNGVHAISGQMLFAGLQDAYFAAVVLPESGTSIDFQTWQDRFKPTPQDTEDVPHVGMAVGGAARNEFLLFVGPKDQDVLKATHPRLPQLVDWGWFGFIAKPLFSFLNFLNDTTTKNWGWAIVLATVIINVVLLPLRLSSLRSSQKMAALQPQVKAINKKYEGLSMRDPRKQKQNEELMELYTKSGVNPMGGCIPLLLQMPFFFAFFKVLDTAIELRGASWLWVPDLSQPEVSWFKVLPIIMLVSQVLMTKMTPTPTADSSQARLMMIMPIVLVAMFYNASSGLVLYWLTGNLVGIVQQFFFNKWFHPASPAAAPAKAKK
jgi:YidC/Oxa1 family membrane protein insertase